jgi:hypothetical protein
MLNSPDCKYSGLHRHGHTIQLTIAAQVSICGPDGYLPYSSEGHTAMFKRVDLAVLELFQVLQAVRKLKLATRNAKHNCERAEHAEFCPSAKFLPVKTSIRRITSDEVLD